MNMNRVKLLNFFFTVVLAGAIFVLVVRSNAIRKLHTVESGTNFAKSITYDGEQYRYCDDLVTLLCLGIDGRGKAEENKAIGFGPRADSIYTMVLNPKQKKITLLSISRDTITDIRIFDSLGQEVGWYPLQIGAQYSNGDGLNQSCELQVEAVGRLLEGIPIHGYCALYWNGIAKINDAVGQVEVDVPEDLVELNPWSFKKTGLTKLTGEQAMEYMRDRDKTITGGNESRSLRQRNYLEALYRQTKSKIKNPAAIIQIYQAAKDYLVTDLDMDEIMLLASWVTDWNLNELQICALEGVSIDGESHDEFMVDEEEKQRLLLELFYERY